MTKFLIRDITACDYRRAADIYNSNPRFLAAHLGVDRIDAAFVAEEASAMDRAGFRSCVIVDRETRAVQGLLDYRPGEETYLSLLMLAAPLQGKGLGRALYTFFESSLLPPDCRSVRIDVVTGHAPHALPFWTGLGFSPRGSVTLTWRARTNTALVMGKTRDP